MLSSPEAVQPGVISLITPLAAVVLALATRQVYLSLLAGIYLGRFVICGDPLIGLEQTVEACVMVMTSPGNVRVIFFVTLVGAILLLANRTGGVKGFVQWMTSRGWGGTSRSAQLLTLVVGLVVFVETSISCLVAGAVGRPLCDRARVSREKLAFLCDSMAAPVCAIMLVVNAWGAFLMGHLENLGDLGGLAPMEVLLWSVPYNFYSLLMILLAFLLVLLGRDVGPMARAERRARVEGKVLREGARPLMSEEITTAGPDPGVMPRARHFLLPLLVMLCMMPLGLYLTGAKEVGHSWRVFPVMAAGSGSTAVLWAVLLALVLGVVMARVTGIFNLAQATELVIKGAGGLASMAVLMILAFAIGETCKELQTGEYVGQVLQGMESEWLPPLIFLSACLVAFATGTSWGCMAIMIPLAIPAALATGLGAPLATAAVLSGAVFGDHCSPISDTTLVSSMASASDHVDHVRTQLPYALAAALLALVGFYLAGL